MDHRTFIKACKLLQARGSSYEELISPFWSEVQDGVVLPTLGKVIPRLESKLRECPWDEAISDAAAAGLTLPSREELQYMRHHLSQINGLLLANNGHRLPRNKSFWSGTEHLQGHAWYVDLESGTTYYTLKSATMYYRPLAELKIL